MYFNYFISYTHTPSMTSNISKQSIWNTCVIISQWYRIKLSLRLFNHILLNARDLKWHVPRLMSQTVFGTDSAPLFQFIFIWWSRFWFFTVYLFFFIFLIEVFPTFNFDHHFTVETWSPMFLNFTTQNLSSLSTFEWYLCVSL